MYMGDFLRGQMVRRIWTTRALDGARINLSDVLEAGDIVVLKDGNPTALTTPGLTVSTAIGSRTGVHSVAVDTTAGTDYTPGSDFTVLYYPDTETIDGKLTAAVLMEFSIENRGVNLATVPGQTAGARPLLGIVDSGVAQSVSGTTLRLRAATEFNNANVNTGAVIAFRGSAGGWQARAITGFNETSKDVAFDAVAFVPSGTVTYFVYAGAPVSASQKFPATLSGPDLAPEAVTKIVNAVVPAMDGGDGYAVSKDLPNNRITRIIPGVRTVHVPAEFNPTSIGVDRVG